MTDLLAVELAACSHFGIPHSVFIAWPAVDRAVAIEHLLAPPVE